MASRRNTGSSLCVSCCLSRQEMCGALFADACLSVRSQRLVIHPDKCPHPRAPEAFDILKKVNFDPHHRHSALTPSLHSRPRANSEIPRSARTSTLGSTKPVRPYSRGCPCRLRLRTITRCSEISHRLSRHSFGKSRRNC